MQARRSSRNRSQQQRAASFRDAHAAVGRALSGAPGATSDSLNVTAAAMLDRVHARLESANVFDALDGGGGPSTRNARGGSSTRHAPAGSAPAPAILRVPHRCDTTGARSPLHECARMTNVTLLCSDGPHHLYLAAELVTAFGRVRVIVERARTGISPVSQRNYRAYSGLAITNGDADYQDTTRTAAAIFFATTNCEPGTHFDVTPVFDIWKRRGSTTRRARRTARGHVRRLYRDGHQEDRRGVAVARTARAHHQHPRRSPAVLPGNHCFFFALHHGEFDKLSTTIHRVSAGLDTGAIISRHPVRFSDGDNSETLYSRAERAVDESRRPLEAERRSRDVAQRTATGRRLDLPHARPRPARRACPSPRRNSPTAPAAGANRDKVRG